MEFFATPEHSDELAFNIGWHEKPMRVITSWRGGPRAVHHRIPSEVDRRAAWQLLIGANEVKGELAPENQHV